MKKNILLLASIIYFSFNSISQNITLNKTLDNDIKLERGRFFDYPKRKNTQYWKVQENKILRFEEDKLQLFNSDFDKEWEIDVPITKCPLNENTYRLCSDENNIFIFQGAYLRSSQLIKVTYDGSKEVIDLSTIIEVATLFDMEMQIINEEVFLFLRGNVLEDTKKTSKFDFYVLKFDKNGNFLTYSNITSENEKIKNEKWRFSEIQNNEILLKRVYYKDSKGKIKVERSKNSESFDNFILMSTDLKPISNKNIKSPHSRIWKDRYVPTKFDSSTTIELDGMKLRRERNFASTTSFDEIKLTINGETTTNIIKDIIELCGNDLYSKTINKFRFVDAVRDPLNNNICIYSHIRFNSVMEGQKCLLVLDENLKVVKIVVFLASYWDHLGRDISNYNENISFEYKKHKNNYGKSSSNHAMNAYEYAAEKGELEVLYTIVNYANYQLLFCDNKLTKKTSVLKFEK
jgi:hypothetical protein